jgi:hypothetical protein
MGRFLSPDPSGIAWVNPVNPQSWNLYAYVMNNPLINTDPTGLECVWDNGSYDSEDDPDTGNGDNGSGQTGVAKCQNAGGTWMELGQNGGWSGDNGAGDDNNLNQAQLKNLVGQIQQGQINMVAAMGTDGTPYITTYGQPVNGQSMVNATIMQGQETFYGYYNNDPSSAAVYSTTPDPNGQTASALYSYMQTHHFLDPTNDDERMQIFLNEMSKRARNPGCVAFDDMDAAGEGIDKVNDYSPVDIPNPGRKMVNWFRAFGLCQ